MGLVEREGGSSKAPGMTPAMPGRTPPVGALAVGSPPVGSPMFVAFVALAFVVALAPSVARAADTSFDDRSSRQRPLAEAPSAAERSDARDPFRIKPGYAHLFATALVGSGLRFNNPYRLATPLGGDAESVSRSATYVDVGGAVTFGHPFGLQHGVALRTAVAVEGIGQLVLTPSYVVWRRWTKLALFGRAGVPLVLTPDATMGLEGSAGAAWFFLGGIGATAEIVGDLFYGTGTADVATTTYPMLSLQAGLIVSYEVLP